MAKAKKKEPVETTGAARSPAAGRVTVSELMTRDVSCCSSDATAQQVAKVMAERNVGSVPITDDGGKLAGIVTDRDLAVRLVARGADPRSEKITDYVTTEVQTLGPDMPIEEAVRLMEAHQVRRLPVVDGGRLVGIVSLGDLATRIPEPTMERERIVGEALEEISKPSRPE